MKPIWVFDNRTKANPVSISTFPTPAEADYVRKGGHFGPHNVHENRSGTFQSDRIVFVTYFNAGLRVFDTADPLRPAEIASYVPAAPAGQPAIQLNDVLVSEDGLIFVTDRVRGGLYILRGTMGPWPASAT